MGFGFLNGFPVVGHVKGFYHKLSGDGYAAKEAFQAANRTSLVMVGGACGAVGGPAGSIAAAAAAGALFDTLDSASSRECKGIVKGLKLIATDLENGKVPIGSTCTSTLMVCSDMLSGLGGSGLAQGVNIIVKQSAKEPLKYIVIEYSKAAVKEAAFTTASATVTKTVGDKFSDITSEIQNRESQNSKELSSSNKPSPSKIPSETQWVPSPSQQTSSSGTSSGGSSSSGSGSQQPQRNQNNNGACNQQQDETHISLFLQILKDILGIVGDIDLKDIVVSNRRIFQNLNLSQLKSLKKLIKDLKNNGLLRVSIETVIEMFRQLDIDDDDVTYKMFMNLAEFVAVYIEEYLQWKRAELEATYGNQQSLDDILSFTKTVLPEIPVFISYCLKLFKSLKDNIQIETIRAGLIHNFQHIFSAVYHYHKHRRLPNGRILTTQQYFALLQRMLKLVQQKSEYTELVDPNHPRTVFKCIISDPDYDQIMIILKVQNGRVVVSTLYVLDKK